MGYWPTVKVKIVGWLFQFFVCMLIDQGKVKVHKKLKKKNIIKKNEANLPPSLPSKLGQ